jgi:hypothetical protein
MSLRLLAQELYRLLREIQTLEKALETASVARRMELEETLRAKRAEKIRLQRLLDGRLDR